MRVADQPTPAVTGPRPVSPWPAALYVAIERLPTAAYTWDDDDARVVWDAATGAYVWDDPALTTAMLDATCAVHGVEIDYPAPDDLGRFPSASATITLANPTGAWSQYDTSGRLVYFAPGRNVQLWARIAGADWWLFSGEVARWDERTDGTVEVEAVDAFTNLNQGVGEWDPGSFGQKPGARLAAICTQVAYPGPTRFATGDVTLHSWRTTATPLEEMQAVALSDGGILGVDADATLVYLDRSWPVGRADQTTVPVLTDNICSGPVVVWDLTLATDDELANVVTLTNVEKVTATAQDPASMTLYRRRTLEHDTDQWVTQAEGNTLAAALLARQRSASLRVDGFTLHLHDPTRNLWQTGIDLRRGDLVRLIRSQTAVDGPELVDVNLIVWGIHHAITPSAWTVEAATTRAVSSNAWWRWDQAGITWDDPTDPPVWTY